MWKSISRSMSSFGSKQNLKELDKESNDFSGDDNSSNASDDEGLECPICWESFNIVENVPYVLWCGHTLCKNCIMGLRCASLKVSSQQIKIPLFVSCPWCNLMTLRLVYHGNLKFPSKNYFLLWVVESRNGDRVKSPLSMCKDRQQIWSPRCTSVVGNYYLDNANWRMHRLSNSTSVHNHDDDGRVGSERSQQISFQKSLDFFIRMTAKFPLVIILLVILSALTVSAGTLLLYLVITVVFAVPAFLVLYFAYPALDWLGREIRT